MKPIKCPSQSQKNTSQQRSLWISGAANPFLNEGPNTSTCHPQNQDKLLLKTNENHYQHAQPPRHSWIAQEVSDHKSETAKWLRMQGPNSKRWTYAIWKSRFQNCSPFPTQKAIISLYKWGLDATHQKSTWRKLWPWKKEQYMNYTTMTSRSRGRDREKNFRPETAFIQ